LLQSKDPRFVLWFAGVNWLCHLNFCSKIEAGCGDVADVLAWMALDVETPTELLVGSWALRD
jgi:hypothetical protein